MRKKFIRVVEGDLSNHLLDVSACAQLLLTLGHRNGVARSPVSGAVDPDAFLTVHLEDVRGPLRRALGVGIERHPRPEAPIQDQLDGVFLDVIDQNPARIHACVLKCVEDDPRALELVLEVGCVNQNHLVVGLRKIEVFLEDLQFVARVLVESDLPDAQHGLAFEEIGNDREHFSSETKILRFLGVDAEPGMVGDAVLRGSCRFGFGQSPEVVVETLSA